jgi:uncharacterized cupin superfamily protein
VSHLAHWDDAESRRREAGHLAARWTDLGTAAGSSSVGVQRIEVEAGRWSTPAHEEQTEEEIFYVLGGSGISWQEGESYEVGPGDCLVHLAEEGTHTLRAGPEGLDVLAFGQRAYATGTHLPRAGVSWFGTSWVESGTGAGPWQREAAVGAPEVHDTKPRPPTIVGVDAVEPAAWGRGSRVEALRRDLGRAAGSLRTGLRHVTVPPGKWGVVAHCHSAEEELFVVLDGEGVVELGDEEHPIRRGTVVARPPGTGVAHSFRAGGPGLVYLAYGTRESNDVCWYPRSRKLSFRGLGVIARVVALYYWDGEVVLYGPCGPDGPLGYVPGSAVRSWRLGRGVGRRGALLPPA